MEEEEDNNMIFQSFNKKTQAWVKIKKKSDGKTCILDVKQKEPLKKFVGIKIKKKK